MKTTRVPTDHGSLLPVLRRIYEGMVFAWMIVLEFAQVPRCTISKRGALAVPEVYLLGEVLIGPV